MNSGQLLVLLSDRDITGNGVEVDFFGEKTKVPAGPALVALGTGVPIISAATYFEPNNGHSARFFEPVIPGYEDDVAGLSQRITYQLENSIRQAPDQWFVMQPNWPSDYAEPS